MNREIPGYFYDPEKKKYFKIEKNHTAPEGATYSQDKVQGIKRKQEELAKREQDAKRKAKEKIRKAIFYQHPLVDSGREVGTWIPSATARLDKQARVFACALRKATLRDFTLEQPTPPIVNFNVRHIIRSKEGHLITGITWGGSSALSIAYPSSNDDEWTYPNNTERLLDMGDVEISSLSLSPMGHILSTILTPSHGPRAELPVTIRPIPNIDAVARGNFGEQYSIVTPQAPLGSWNKGTIWASAASQRTDKPVFAIGQEHGLYLLIGEDSRWVYGDVCGREKDVKNVRSVDWVDHNVFSFGTRDALLGFYDMRVGRSVLHLHHSESAYVIRQADEYRVLAAGWERMALYDKRFAPPFDREGKAPHPLADPEAPDHRGPYLTFPHYAPTPNYNPSVDTCKELGLVVSSTTERKKVQLFSLQTGRPVESPLTKYFYNSGVNCVKFDYHKKPGYEEGAQTPVVLVGQGQKVTQWSW